MGQPAKRRATYDDLLAVPEHLVAEIIFGELVTHPRPAIRHARAATRLSGRLAGPFDSNPGEPGGWILLFEPELHLSDDVLVPDLAGWRRERVPERPDAAAFKIAPDWVCEVLSPSTVATDRVEKMQIYAREHVSHVWMIDPIAESLEVFRLRDGAYALMTGARGAAVVRCEPFEAVPLDLAPLWAW